MELCVRTRSKYWCYAINLSVLCGQISDCKAERDMKNKTRGENYYGMRYSDESKLNKCIIVSRRNEAEMEIGILPAGER